MPPITNILVPVDFSDPSLAALRYATQLADATGAALHVLHVSVNPYVTAGYPDLHPLPRSWFEEVEADAKQRLDGLFTPEERARYRVVLVHRSGSAATEILDYVSEHGTIDLIVMSTHGRGGVARLMMGSVADTVLRSAPCPVLTLHRQEPRLNCSQAA